MVHAASETLAFEGFCQIAAGSLAVVAAEAKKVIDRGEKAPVLIFDTQTGEQIDLDFHGSPDEVIARIPAAPTKPEASELTSDDKADEKPRGRGRPKLGVVAHEVTLLPQHWDWLYNQPGGASVTLRKLVTRARRESEQTEHVRTAREAAYRFLTAIAGNLRDFEEVTRALFAGHEARFIELTETWPIDVRSHARAMAARSFVNSAA